MSNFLYIQSFRRHSWSNHPKRDRDALPASQALIPLNPVPQASFSFWWKGAVRVAQIPHRITTSRPSINLTTNSSSFSSPNTSHQPLQAPVSSHCQSYSSDTRDFWQITGIIHIANICSAWEKNMHNLSPGLLLSIMTLLNTARNSNQGSEGCVNFSKYERGVRKETHT